MWPLPCSNRQEADFRRWWRWRRRAERLLLSTNQRRASGTCQSGRRVYLERVWGELWVSASVWWAISWLTDGVLNDWWGGWFGWVRRRPDRLNPSSVYGLNIKVALAIFFPFIFHFFPLSALVILSLFFYIFYLFHVIIYLFIIIFPLIWLRSTFTLTPFLQIPHVHSIQIKMSIFRLHQLRTNCFGSTLMYVPSCFAALKSSLCVTQWRSDWGLLLECWAIWVNIKWISRRFYNQLIIWSNFWKKANMCLFPVENMSAVTWRMKDVV